MNFSCFKEKFSPSGAPGQPTISSPSPGPSQKTIIYSVLPRASYNQTTHRNRFPVHKSNSLCILSYGIYALKLGTVL